MTKQDISTFNFLISLGKMKSKVEGRRNWVIVCDNKHIIYKGSYGEAQRRSMLSWRVQDMIDSGIIILYFTYKKDYLNTVGQLEG